MSRKGNCLYDAVKENFFKSLKRNLFMEIKGFLKNKLILEIFNLSKANWRRNTLKFGTKEKGATLF